MKIEQALEWLILGSRTDERPTGRRYYVRTWYLHKAFLFYVLTIAVWKWDFVCRPCRIQNRLYWFLRDSKQGEIVTVHTMKAYEVEDT
jgi:hypothetical protein